MSLQVWLPLTGHLNNQGLSNVTVTNNGATVDNNGKIGKCYYFNGSSSRIYNDNLSLLNDEMSGACWAYINSAASRSYLFSLGGNSSINGSKQQIGIWIERNRHPYICGMGSSLDTGYVLELNTWYHICMTYKGATSKLYINGALVYTGTNANTKQVRNRFCVGAKSNSDSGASAEIAFPLDGKLNDVRIYDHALSAKEVKELSKGLVLHYPLSDRCLQQMNNCFSNPRFEEGSAGWTVWGGSGAAGSAGLTTDKQWIYRKDQTYARWVANASTATSYYIMYQQPAFTGGYRSLCCICKEEHEYEITNEMMHPDWNATVGSKEKKFDKIISLGDGFYYCECNGFQQNGSNDLVAFVIHPGYKIYFSEAYLENDRKLCSDILFQTTTVYDVSGYNYHGTASTDLIASEDTPRYNVCSHFVGTNYIYLTSPSAEVVSISLWVKWDSIPSGQSVVFMDYKSRIGFGLMSTGILCGSVSGSYYTFSKASIQANKWYHFVIVSPSGATNTTRKLYINGVEQTATSNTSKWSYTIDQLQIGKRSTTSDGFVGCISDFRMYTTVLSAEDVKQLYNTAASLANNGTLFAYSFNEV